MLEPPGNRWPRWMVTLDRIRLSRPATRSPARAFAFMRVRGEPWVPPRWNRLTGLLHGPAPVGAFHGRALAILTALRDAWQDAACRSASRRAVTHVSQAYPDRVEVRGRDLSARPHGSPDLHEYFILLTGREPTDDERYFLDLLLVAIAEHGMMPTNVAARMTLAADRRRFRARCGGDSRRRPRRPRTLGDARGCSRRRRLRSRGGRARRGCGEVCRGDQGKGGKVPGFGHPVHRPLDQRAERILDLADERGAAGRVPSRAPSATRSPTPGASR